MGFNKVKCNFSSSRTLLGKEYILKGLSAYIGESLAHLQDNLLRAGTKLKHNGVDVTTDEILSPTVERLAVLRWMELIHPKLPALVARTFAYDLQRMTLKDIQPQIADGLENFLEELNRDDAPIQVSKAYSAYRSQPRGRSSRGAFNQPWHSRRPTPSDVRKSKPQCRVCQAEKRPFIGHDMASCHFISESERRTLIRSCQVDVDYDDQHYNDDDQVEYAQEDFHNTECLRPVTSTYDANILRVATSPSPT